MKKLVLTLGIVLMGIVFVQAQQKREAAIEKKTAAVVNKMSNTAHLTSDQASKIEPFVKQFLQEKVDNNSKFSNDPAGMNKATELNKEELKNNLKTVLTADQMKQLADYYSKATPSSTYAPKQGK